MKLKGSIATALITAILLFVYYSYQIVNADKISYGQWGDGYKNYYTLAYYLENDHGTHFSGMNYPYGEHVLFTDNQPGVAWILKVAGKLAPSVKKHLHGFIGWAIFLSVIATAVLVFLALVELEVICWLAVCFAVLIALLSPQLMRLMGHYSLAYSFYIPLVLYLTIRYFNTAGLIKYFALITGVITSFSFLHVYYLAMAGLFVILAGILYFLGSTKPLKERLKFALLLIASGVIPFITLKVFLFVTDPITDRPTAPFGFLEYNATIFDVLLHVNSFTGEIVGRMFPNMRIAYSAEGLGYIGFVAGLTLLAISVTTIIKLFKRQNFLKQFYPFNFLLPAGLGVLLFAMAFPFTLDPLEKYHDLLPSALKQFRALGRFTWVFYYVATIFSALVAARTYLYIKQRRAWLAYLFSATVIAIWFADVNMVSVRYQRKFKDNTSFIDEQAEKETMLAALAKVNKSPSDFQALFPMPLFLNGSEKLYIESEMSYNAMKVSLYTRLPIVCGQMSRTSESQSFQIARLLSDDYLRKDILSVYPNRKPLLLIYNDGELKPQERKLFEKASYLCRANGVNYYELPLSAFNDINDSIKRYYAIAKNKFSKHGNVFTADSISHVLLLDFDNTPFADATFGKGAHCADISGPMLYFDTLPNGLNNTEYELSLWAYSDDRRAAFSDVYVTQVDTSGKDLEYYHQCAKFNYNTYGKWVMCQINFKLLNGKNKIYIASDAGYNTFDEIMIRPKNTDVVSKIENDSVFMFNNFPIR